MTALMLMDLAQVTGGRLVGGDVAFDTVSTDTRSLASGALFVALKGPSFDGHEFVAAAIERGAVGALVERHVTLPLPQVVVPDALQALSVFARAWRKQCAIPVVGITGSNGKTTTKEMIGAILSRQGPCLVTQGNLNNHIGVPLTLMRLNATHRTAVIEMGANHQGEIAALCAIAEPNVGIVTNAGEAHLEGFGGIDGVAKGKGEMFRALSVDGTAVINADDKYCSFWRTNTQARRVLTFGLSPDADFTARNVQARSDANGLRFDFDMTTPSGLQACSLALAGTHNLRNALGAAAAAFAVGASLSDIATGLSAMKPVPGRLNLMPAVHGAFMLDDSYNANPSSLRAGIDTLLALPGEHWLVLGDMLELGVDAEQLHASMGAYARTAGVDRMFAVGPRAKHAAGAFGAGAEWFDSMDELIDRVRDLVQGNVTILIKGSRGARMERVTSALAPDGASVVNGH